MGLLKKENSRIYDPDIIQWKECTSTYKRDASKAIFLAALVTRAKLVISLGVHQPMNR
jgi:hypothetical protein